MAILLWLWWMAPGIFRRWINNESLNEFIIGTVSITKVTEPRFWLKLLMKSVTSLKSLVQVFLQLHLTAQYIQVQCGGTKWWTGWSQVKGLPLWLDFGWSLRSTKLCRDTVRPLQVLNCSSRSSWGAAVDSQRRVRSWTVCVCSLSPSAGCCLLVVWLAALGWGASAKGPKDIRSIQTVWDPWTIPPPNPHTHPPTPSLALMKRLSASSNSPTHQLHYCQHCKSHNPLQGSSMPHPITWLTAAGRGGGVLICAGRVKITNLSRQQSGWKIPGHREKEEEHSAVILVTFITDWSRHLHRSL